MQNCFINRNVCSLPFKKGREQPTHPDWKDRKKYITNAMFSDYVSKETFE